MLKQSLIGQTWKPHYINIFAIHLLLLGNTSTFMKNNHRNIRRLSVLMDDDACAAPANVPYN